MKNLFEKLTNTLISICKNARIADLLANKTGDDRIAFIKKCKEGFGMNDELIKECLSLPAAEREAMLSAATVFGLVLAGDEDIYAEVKRLYPQYAQWWDMNVKKLEEVRSKTN